MDKEKSEVLDILGVILEKMATKEDLAAIDIKLDGKIDNLHTEMKQEFAFMRADIRSLHDDVKGIHTRLEEIQMELKNHSGYAKEIDHLLERVVVIEKHLNIQQQTVA